jgi:hypothetical protein
VIRRRRMFSILPFFYARKTLRIQSLLEGGRMGKYGEAAVLATECYLNAGADSPVAAWKIATHRVFPKPAGQNKCCPKGAYLGLCEEGLVKGVPPGRYTRSKDNKFYALEAWRALQSQPGLVDDQTCLWAKARGTKHIKHNEQMDVVTALWRRGLLHRNQSR